MKIAYYLPEKVLKNSELSEIYPDWTAEKIYKKTGISERRVSAKNENCSDMAISAANRLFYEYGIDRNTVEFIILVTQSPDYQLPTTACIVQNKLGIPTTAGAFDINLGCSGYIYGLSVAKAMIISGMVNNVLLITSEMYSKFIHPMDKSVRTIFGDGATATFIDRKSSEKIGQFCFGTDGNGFDKLIIPSSGMNKAENNNAMSDSNGNIRTPENLFMDGAEIFNFTIDTVPEVVNNVLKKNNLNLHDIDLFIFHQANEFILKYLKKIIKIPNEKFYVNLEKIGNTVSSSIPIALKMAENDNKLKKCYKVMLVGFGVGLSWGATIITY